MSTRCRIGIKNEDGTIRSIYCHFDGYPDGVGQALLDSYMDVEKINKLLDLGDISCLGSEPVSKAECWDPFSAVTNSDYTLAYRDRGEDCPAEISKDKEGYYDLAEGCDYAYLFYPEKNAWKMCTIYRNKEAWLKEYLEKEAN